MKPRPRHYAFASRGRRILCLTAWLLVPGLLVADSLPQALSESRFEDALRLLAPLLKAQPRDPRLWTAHGVSLKGLNRVPESLGSFAQALRIDPAFVPALKGAAEAAYGSRDKRAAGFLARLLKLEPANQTAHAMAAVLAFEAGNCRLALAHFDKAGPQADRDELAASQRGHCLLRTGRAPEAERIFARLLEAAPGSAAARYNLGVAQLGSQKAAEAASTLAPLAEMGDAEALNVLAGAEATLGRVDAAIAMLRRAVELAPKDERNYLDLALLCQKYDALALADEILDAGLGRLPESARLYAMRGVIQAQMGEIEGAARSFEQASRLEPEQSYASVGMSVLLSQTGRTESAVRLLREKLAAAPNDPNLNYLLADALIREGPAPQQPEFAQARQALLRTLRARPDHAKARAALGKLYLQQGEPARAVQELELALKHDAGNRAALSQLLVALRRLGREKEAAAVSAKLRQQYERDLGSEGARPQIRISRAGQ
jgi:tetratricopeptide (TPR) repeat protein